MSTLTPVQRLQFAALDLIDSLTQDINSGAVEGVFRVSGKSQHIKKVADSLLQEKKEDFSALSQIEKAHLLKELLARLRDKNAYLFELSLLEKKDAGESLSKFLQSTSYLHQKLTYKLFNFLHQISHQDGIVEKTKMSADNLSIMIGPNIFPNRPMTDLASATRDIDQVNVFTEYLINYAPIMNAPKVLTGTHYKHQTRSAVDIRYHSHTVLGTEFEGLRAEFRDLQGDYLKSQILLYFKAEIENAAADELDDVVRGLKNSAEYRVLKTGQGFATRIFPYPTSSVTAFKEMIKEKKEYFALMEAHEHNASLKS